VSERVAFTGERLHEGSELFGVDLVRHRAAYRHAIETARREGRGERVLDMGCGSGYGAAELAESLPRVVGVDRVPPDRHTRRAGLHFVRADLRAMPLRPRSFPMVVSFQVIEHLVDPAPYLTAIADALTADGVALVSTPNLLQSDRENPYHVHEYEADELRERLLGWFEEVEMLGVGATPPVAAYYDARLARIARITRLDVLGLRRRLPRGVIDWLFAKFALVVRRGIQQDTGLPEADFSDFPIAAADDRCLDLLAVCRRPRERQ